MLDFIRQWVVGIVALVLFIVMFEIILPTGRMKKYVNLATGTILIIAIISPLGGLMGKNLDLTALQAKNSNILDKIQVQKDSKLLEDEQMKQIVEVYREKLIEQLEQNAAEVEGVETARADVIFNEDYNSENFGEIKRVYLEIVPSAKSSPGNGAAGVSETNGAGSPEAVQKSGATLAEKTSAGGMTVKEIEPVRPVEKIGRIVVGNGAIDGAVSENCDPALLKRLEDRISSVFGISSDNIVISRIRR